MKNNLVNQDIKTDKPVPMSYEALKADRDAQKKLADALAVENAAMRNALESIRIYSSDTLSGPSDSVPDMAAWLRDGIEHLHQVSTIQTPATDAALAEVRAKAIEAFAAQQEEKFKAAALIGATHLESAHEFAALQARAFAVDLREGRV